MDKVIEVIKAHPLAIGAGVIVVLLLMRGGSSSNAGTNAASMVGASLQSQQIASSTNVALAGVNADVSKANAGFASANYLGGIAAAASIKQSDNAAMIGAFTSMLSSGNNSEAIAANRQVNLAQITASQTVALDATATQLKGLNAQITGNQNLTNTLVQADANKTASIYSFEQANLPSLLQHAENMAKIGGDTAVNLATVNGRTSVNLATVNGQTSTALAQTNTSAARTNAETAQQSSGLDSLVKIGSTILSFLG